MAQGEDLEDIRQDYPTLSVDDLRAGLSYPRPG
ncbi:MAG: DUF433 domain-containing protein [Bacteroidia bacterium]|nr:DUF433 domain-containing protein [Bacteroidia bacterium]